MLSVNNRRNGKKMTEENKQKKIDARRCTQLAEKRRTKQSMRTPNNKRISKEKTMKEKQETNATKRES
jgi:hypothetical protein